MQTKNKIIEFRKDKKFQFYVVPDIIAPLKYVIRGLPESSKVENIQREILNKGFEVTKVVQMTIKVDARVLPLFLIHVIKNENSKTILNLRDLFKIRIET